MSKIRDSLHEHLLAYMVHLVTSAVIVASVTKVRMVTTDRFVTKLAVVMSDVFRSTDTSHCDPDEF